MTHFLQLLVLLAVTVAAAKLAGAVAVRIGQPAVFGEILIGLVLGPTVLNILGLPIFSGPIEGASLEAGTPMLAFSNGGTAVVGL